MNQRRKLVLVDVENLCGCHPRLATPATYRFVMSELREALPVTDEDLVVVGVHPGAAFEVADAMPSARVVVRAGADGADTRLLEELSDEAFLARRFREVVVASGDHLFVDAVQRLNHHDVATTVAALPGQLAGALRLVAQRVVWLRRPPATPSVVSLGAA